MVYKFPIWASSSASVRRINSEYRSLRLASNCCLTLLRDSMRSTFFRFRCNSSGVSADLPFAAWSAIDSSICASTDLLSQPLAMP
jgi:hypothetical protein